MRTKPARSPIAAAAVTSLAAVAACVAIAAADGRQSPAGAPGRPGPVTAIDLALLAEAERVLTADCMDARGFHYELGQASTAGTAAARGSSTRIEAVAAPYGNDDLDQAATHGFGEDFARAASEQAERVRQRDPVSRYAASLSAARNEEFFAALYGGPGDPSITVRVSPSVELNYSTVSCAAQAKRQLYGDVRTFVRSEMLTDQVNGKAQAAAMKSPRYRDLLPRWVACMRSAGHRAASPATLRSSFQQLSATWTRERRRHHERTLAVAEARCARRTGLVAVARAEERHAIDSLRAHLAAEYQDLERLRHRALPVARELLDETRDSG